MSDLIDKLNAEQPVPDYAAMLVDRQALLSVAKKRARQALDNGSHEDWQIACYAVDGINESIRNLEGIIAYEAEHKS